MKAAGSLKATASSPGSIPNPHLDEATVAEMKWISFKLPYDLARLLCIFWFFEWKMIKIF